MFHSPPLIFPYRHVSFASSKNFTCPSCVPSPSVMMLCFLMSVPSSLYRVQQYATHLTRWCNLACWVIARSPGCVSHLPFCCIQLLHAARMEYDLLSHSIPHAFVRFRLCRSTITIPSALIWGFVVHHICIIVKFELADMCVGVVIHVLSDTLCMFLSG